MDVLVDRLDEAGRPRWLVRLAAGLRRGARPTVDRDLEPLVAVLELRAWAQDDGRWDPRATKDWHSLLDDLDAAWSRLGPKLKKVADVDPQLDALRAVRAGGTVSADSRLTVEGAARTLETAFDGERTRAGRGGSELRDRR
jgi:hypothetical protein